MIDVPLSFTFSYLMGKLRHGEIMHLAGMIEPESNRRLFDFRVTTPHGFFQRNVLGNPILD